MGWMGVGEMGEGVEGGEVREEELRSKVGGDGE